MTSIFFADSNPKIRKLKDNKSYPVQPKSGLSLVKRGTSKYFEGRMRFPFNASGKKESVKIGVFEKEILVEDAIHKWNEIKVWSKNNNKNPKLFGKVQNASGKTFKEVANEYMEEVYVHRVKEEIFNDRKNKINQVLKYIGDEMLIADLQRDRRGRPYCKKMLKTVFPHAPVQLTRVRQLMSWIFGYAEREEYIQQDQNPLYIKFDWETGTKRRVSDKTFADTITSKSLGMLPEFLKTVNANECNGSVLTDLATKAHLLMCIRSAVIVRLEWDWYDPEEDQWVIPPECKGLKNKREQLESGSCEKHIIPSTPEINQLMKKLKAVTGWQKYCFPSLGGGKNPHLGESTINNHFRNLGWKGKQTAHQWRSVITTLGVERSNLDYEVIDRQLGRKGHLNGTRGHYDRSTLLEKRKEFMKWWSKSLIQEGLII